MSPVMEEIFDLAPDGAIERDVKQRAESIYREQDRRTAEVTDRLFAALLAFEFFAGIIVALIISPKTWAGRVSDTHTHVYAAVFLGSLLCAPTIVQIYRRPGEVFTRHLIAVAQMLVASLMIHLSGGRIETHFLVFGSLAFLAFYRDWRVLISASIVVTLDHAIRGVWWPESVFGLGVDGSLRWLEHAAWVVFEDIFLITACVRGHREMLQLAKRQALLEATNQLIESEVERRTAELTIAKERGEEGSRAKSEFLANMSHEIRTPLTAILGHAELLSEADLTAEHVEHIEIMTRNGHHLLRVIDDILDVSKIEAGKLEIHPAACSVAVAVAETASLMRVRADDKGIALEVVFDGPVPELVRTDATRLRQVLMNLVGNAIKFTETGVVTIRVAIEPSENDRPMLRIEVVDSGIGMSSEQLDRVFSPFTQADSSTSRRFGGTGLGLTISRRLCEMLGGELSATSAPGSGSCFSILIDPGPLEGVRMLEGVREADASAARVAPQPAPERPLEGRVLLAEDGADNRRLIETILRRFGLEVELTCNGRQAVDRVCEAPPDAPAIDLILMDMQMPVLDGYSATRELRERGCFVPILALTAHAMEGDREKCIRAGCDDFANKPIRRDILRGALSRWMKKRSSQTGHPTP